ncbi:MAG: CHAT domain-containing protein [Gemmatimonadetes bacterium]|nr:CHAT domain-containing protein [Gemmatimonadota bacterium]
MSFDTPLRSAVAFAFPILLIATSVLPVLADQNEAPVFHDEAMIERITTAIMDRRDSEADSLAQFFIQEVSERTGTESLLYADAIGLLVKARLYANRSAEPETEELARTVLSINEEVHGSDSPELTPPLLRLGQIFELKNEYPAAMEYFERAESILENAGENEGSRYSAVLYRMARVRRMEGDYGASRALYEQCIGALESGDAPDGSRLAQALWSYSILLRRTGDWSASESALRRAIRLRIEEYGETHTQVADLEISLAHTLRQLARYGEARALYRHAIESQEAALGPDHPDIVPGLTGYANLLFEIKSYEDAAIAYERIERILRAAENPDPTDLAGTLHNIGSVHIEARNYDKAREYLESALSLFQDTFGHEHEEVVNTIHSLGVVFHSLEDHENAERRLREAVELAERNLGDSHPKVMQCKDDLGHELLAQRRLEEAEVIFLETRAKREEIFGTAHPAVAVSRTGLALTSGASGDTARAVAQAIEASETRRQVIRLAAQAQAEREALNFATGLDGAPGIAVSLLGSSSPESLVTDVWDEVIRCRGLVLEEVAVRRKRGTFRHGAASAALHDSLQEAARFLSEMALRGPARDEEIEDYRQAIHAARARKESAERELALLTGEPPGEAGSTDTGFEETVGNVESDVAVVSYLLHRKPDFANGAPGGVSFETAYTVFVKPAGRGNAIAIPIGARGEVDRTIELWRQALLAGNERDCRKESEAIRAMLWDPVADYCRNARAVLLVPDGSINLVDFHALRMPDGKFWIEQNPVLRLLATERDLATEESAARGRGLLVMGGADYETASEEDPEVAGDSGTARPFSNAAAIASLRGGCGAFDEIRFAPLPGAGREAADVASAWRSAGGSAVLREGRAASESAFKREAPGKRAIHLATHAFFISGECSPQEGARGIGGTVWSDRGETKLDPLLRSGIALAGANRRKEPAGDEEDGSRGPEEDGVLTAEEIALMDLAGVEMAILSACGTGLGEVRLEEGILGLRRAFRMAGVPALVFSLWDVGDELSQLWMRHFYRELVERADLHEAARAASIASLQARRSEGKSELPVFWAGYVASGPRRIGPGN